MGICCVSTARDETASRRVSAALGGVSRAGRVASETEYSEAGRATAARGGPHGIDSMPVPSIALIVWRAADQPVTREAGIGEANRLTTRRCRRWRACPGAPGGGDERL